MKKFLVLYLAPSSVLEEWMQLDPDVRKTSEEKMRGEWQTWTTANAGMVKETSGAGKTKRVSAHGIEDTKNDVMMFSIVEADSQEAAAKIFEGHPHLGIPKATIEVMSINTLPGMQ